MEFTAKTVSEAVEQGLSQLGLTQENAIITIIEEPTKGLFGRTKGKAVVDIKSANEEKVACKKEVCEKANKENLEENKINALNLVKEVLKIMEIEATCDICDKDEKTIITLDSSDTSSIIGYRGEVLDALQTLAGAMANKGSKEYRKVVVDCESYRDKREDTLIKLAHKLEAKATEMRRDVILEPMNAFERRIIHTALAESTTVTTKSEGKEPNRYIVICPNDKDEFSKPFNAGRNSSDGKKDRNNKSFNKNGKRGGKDRKTSSSPAPKRKTTISFGTYLGNSLKDKE